MPLCQVSLKKVRSTKHKTRKKKKTRKKNKNGQLLLSGSLKCELPWETVVMATRWVTFR